MEGTAKKLSWRKGPYLPLRPKNERQARERESPGRQRPKARKGMAWPELKAAVVYSKTFQQFIK